MSFYNPKNQKKNISFGNYQYFETDNNRLMHRNDDGDMDSCISLRPLGTDKSVAEIMSVASTSNFVAPSLHNLKQVEGLNIENSSLNRNKHGRKAALYQKNLIQK